MSDRFGEEIRWHMDGERLILEGSGKVRAHYPKLNFRVLEIGEGITAIEKDAFREYGGLTKVSLPRSLRYIEARAFLGCSFIEEIENLPPYDRIDKTAFLYAGPTGLQTTIEAAGPMIVEYEDFFDDGPGPWNRPDPAAVLLPPAAWAYMKQFPLAEQLERYCFEGMYFENGEKIVESITLNYDAMDKVLVKDGVLLGVNIASEYKNAWIYVMKDGWEVAEWERYTQEEYPYYDKFRPSYLIRSTRQLLKE